MSGDKQDKEVKRMCEERPDVPAAIWDLEASEEMAQLWDEFQGGL